MADRMRPWAICRHHTARQILVLLWHISTPSSTIGTWENEIEAFESPPLSSLLPTEHYFVKNDGTRK